MEIAQQTKTDVKNNLYPYQESDINTIIEKLEQQTGNYRILYQLPTGGGKTVVFSEIARRFIEKYQRKVAVLTHRTELCRQTSTTLKNLGVSNKIINSNVQRLPSNNEYKCYVAMVETLKNRLKSKKLKTSDVGLVIIDEAHHNSFRKLLSSFENAIIIGVTATPFSSDRNLPMHKTYDELITGENIASLISEGYLAKPKTIKYDVELNTLKTGIHGDFTVSTSDALYASAAMMNLLREAYENHSLGRKTLIFNNGIFTSHRVYELFTEAGYPIRHLDNKTPAAERKEILKWFKKTKNAILTSVSILTTGFDEPTVQSVILNRATTSLTLYHQMIGRGSRKLPRKQTFTIIDLGNNTDRFGEWHEPLDWKQIFENPDAFYEMMSAGTGSDSGQAHHLSPELCSKFQNSLQIAFDIEQEYNFTIANNIKPRKVIQRSVRQHVIMCMENSNSLSEALELAEALSPEIEWRVKIYTKCLDNTTKNYREWLLEDYKSRIRILLRKLYNRKEAS
ncbi:MAG TPA: DEAD/DEAH box helicase [Flavobacterium sp.]|jgi:superfamily II DNA or RNA helicase